MNNETYLFPPSYGQERLWILEQMNPLSVAYNVLLAMEIKGRLNIEVLEKTLQEIIQRHESLRTVIGVLDENPMQMIFSSLETKLLQMDVSELPTEEQSKKIQELIGTGFNISQVPL